LIEKSKLMKPDLTTLNLISARKAIQQQEFSAMELVEACLHQIERLNNQINAFITLIPEVSIQAAVQADAILSHAPGNIDQITLLSLPIAVKDLFDTAGTPTTAGSLFFKNATPAQDAEAIKRLKLAGSVIVGKTNTHEIALGVTGVNPHYGAVRNPWNVDCISGGSSSGSAAAVSCRMCLAALGTDTGGSVRIPASLSGVVGLKPTRGRISLRGVMPLSWNLDHVGTLTNSVADAALLLNVLAGYDPHDPASVNNPAADYMDGLESDIRGWKVGLGIGDYIEASDTQVVRAVNEAAMVLKDLGAVMERVDLSWLRDLALANSRMVQADAAAFHHERLAQHPDWFGEDVRQRLQAGASLSSRDYVLARRLQQEGKRRMEMIFEKYDLLLLPTTPVPAPPIEGTAAVEAASRMTQFTGPFNLTGLPAMSIPCGFTTEGLPIGMQFVSRAWDEKRLLRAGYAYQSIKSWHHAIPPIAK
jgi:aspartyl-tRNA(Asn)/glutamyl-tRNA(Gln) amidotransferase subunit A